MILNEEYFETLRRNYPEVISKDQFYKIAHISKATALYLLQSGLVPCKDTGKKTRRYQIRLDDVILYLIDREIYPEYYKATDHWYEGRSGKYISRKTFRKELLNLNKHENLLVRAFFEEEIASYGDLLSVLDVVGILGYTSSTVCYWCRDKRLKHFKVAGKTIIPKKCLVDFFISEYCCCIKRKTWKHLLLIVSFLDDIAELRKDGCTSNS